VILCFKNAARAVEIDRAEAHDARAKGNFVLAAKLDAGSVFSEGIQEVTHGQFSHAQMWLDGTRNTARCFSSFEPDGTRFQIEDLTVPGLWTLVDIDGIDPATISTVMPEVWARHTADLAWCIGMKPRRYNFTGILGEFSGNKAITSPYDSFCSQCCTKFCQDRRGIFKGDIGIFKGDSTMVAPSGNFHGWAGLYEMAMAAGYKVIP